MVAGTVAVLDLIIGVGVASSDSRASVASLVAWTDVVVVASGQTTAVDGSAGWAHLRVALSLLLGLAASEETTLLARGVVVVWAGTVCLLLLVGAHELELEGSGDEEEDGSNDTAGEDGLVETAGSLVVDSVGDLVVEAILAELAEWVEASAVVAGAFAAVAENNNGDHATNEENIDEDSDEGQAGDTTETAGQEDSKDGVNDSNAGDTLNGLVALGDNGTLLLAIGKDREEVTAG